MALSDLQERESGVWCWERRPRGLPPGEFGARTSYAVVLDGETLLVDPFVADESDPVLAMLDDLVTNRVRILVTMPFHTRSSESLWRRYRRANARIHGHPAVARRLSDATGFEAVLAGHDIAGVARLHPIGRPARSEQPIEIPGRRALVFGDAVVNTGAGELRVWEDPLDTERRRRWWTESYLPTLQRLVELDIDRILVTHGQPVIGSGKTALQHALQREPWQRPKRNQAR